MRHVGFGENQGRYGDLQNIGEQNLLLVLYVCCCCCDVVAVDSLYCERSGDVAYSTGNAGECALLSAVPAFGGSEFPIPR